MLAEDNFPGVGMLHPLEVPTSHQDEPHYSLAPIKAQILQPVSEMGERNPSSSKSK